MSVQSVGEHISLFHSQFIVFAIGIRSWSLQIYVFAEIGIILYSRGSMPRVRNASFKIRSFEMIRYPKNETHSRLSEEPSVS